MDEQRFRARLAALDAAVRALVGHDELPTDELIVTYATALEAWLMRPEPVDDLGEHDPQLTGLCGTFWRAGSALHRCLYLPGHSSEHLCKCSATHTEMTT